MMPSLAAHRSAGILTSWQSRQSLTLDFLSGTVDPRIAFTRASGASYFDATGTLQIAANNVPRIDYGPAPSNRTNWVRNSTMQGGGAGVVPTNWAAFSPGSGIGYTVVGTGTTAQGRSYFDIRLSGTASATIGNSTAFLSPEQGNVIPGAQGQAWTLGVNVQVVAGVLSGTLSQDIAERSASVALVASHSVVISPTGVDTQFVTTATTTAASAAYVQPIFRWGCASGAVVDFTLRISQPQLERGYQATAFIPTSGSIATVAASPLGLLIEEQRTNQIRNPRMEGAVAGSPGTLPTFYTGNSNGDGLSRQIVGTGTESGVPYVDFRYSGTTTGTLGITICTFEGNTQVPAVSGQIWTGSAYVRVVGGSAANINPLLRIFERDVSGNGLIATDVPFVPTAAPLATQRVVATRTFNNAATAYAFSYIYFSYASGVTVDFTLRIGAPQLELGAFATSLILPTAGAPAASTRAAEMASTAATPWFIQGVPASFTWEGSFEGILPGANQVAYQVDNGVASSRYVQYINQAVGTVAAFPQVNGTVGGSATTGAATVNSTIKMGAVFQAATVAVCLNGGAVVSGANSQGLLAGVTTLRVGNNTGSPMNGYVRRIRYWPRALSATELSLVTNPNVSDVALDFDLTQPALDPSITFSRASGGTYFDATGTLKTAANNAPRIDYGPTPAGRTNWIRNSTLQGVGAGTLPTNWAASPAMGTAGFGVTMTQTGFGIENGIPYIEVNIAGTATNTFGLYVRFDTVAPYAGNSVLTLSSYARLISGTLNVTPSLRFDDNAAGAANGSALAPTTAALDTQRFSMTYTPNAGATTVSVGYRFGVTSGAVINATFRVGSPQLERGFEATPFIPTSGSVVTLGATALGLLIEEQRTNAIRNPRAEGAVAGSPGTSPTNWGQGTAQTSIATATEQGMTCADVRFASASVMSAATFLFEAVNAVAASATQVWSGSIYAKLAAGSIANLTDIELTLRFYDASQTFLAQTWTIFTPSSTLARVAITATAPASTAFVALGLRFNTSAAADFTIRVGGPQLELGAFPTSLILPAAGTPAVATRAADQAYVPTSAGSWFNPAEGAFCADFGTTRTPSSSVPIGMSDGTFGNSLYFVGNGLAAIGENASAGVNTGAVVLGDVLNRQAASYGSGTMRASGNGSAATSASMNDGPYPWISRLSIGGAPWGTGAEIGGHMRRVRCWPRALSATELPIVTSLNAQDTTLDLDLTSSPLDPRIAFTRASGASYFDRTGTLQSAVANQPRFDYDPATLAARGLLVEEQRTNSIRNPRGEGAVAGTPGTAPTNWGGTNVVSSGLSASILGTGSESGIPYIDVRIWGTPTITNTGFAVYLFEQAGAIASAASQAWTHSVYLRLMAGSLAGFNNVISRIRQYDSGLVAIGGDVSVALTPTNAPLATQRYTVSLASAAANVAFVMPWMSYGVTSGVPVDITLRIGAPQLEQGAFATSVILPPAGSPGVATRSGELAAMPLGSWFNQSASSVVVSAMIPQSLPGALLGGLALLDDGTTANRIILRNQGTTVLNAAASAAGTPTSSAPAGNFTPGVPFKAGMVAAASAISAAFNGGAVGAISGTLPTSLTTLRLGQNSVNTSLENGYLSRLRYWPRALSNTELQQVTT
jgi:hypothetical protein